MRSTNKWMLVPLAVAMSLGAAAQNGLKPGSPAVNAGTPSVGNAFLPNAVITQGFDAVQVTPGGAADPPTAGTGDCLLNTALAGWFARNLASPLGTTCVFNGGAGTTFPAQGGATTSYAAMNFNNSTGAGNINTWFVTPRVNFGTGAQLQFFTRAAGSFADRLQVRISTAADSGTPDVGTGTGAAATVGTFTTLLLDINPTLVTTAGTCPAAPITAAGATITGYPQGAWCQITINGAALPTTGSGRIAFRYFTDNGGPDGANSNFVGIDTFSFDEGASGTPIAGVGAAVVDFNRQLVGSISTRTATLTNTGTAALNVTALTAPAAPFSLTGGTCSAVPITIAAGASCTLVYTFSPLGEGQFQQVISATTNGGNVSFTLRGQALVSIPLPASSDLGRIALLSLLVGIGLFGLRRRA